MKKLLLLAAICCSLASCMIFKTYNSAAKYKDGAREISLTTDTTIVISNSAKGTKQFTVTPEE